MRRRIWSFTKWLLLGIASFFAIEAYRTVSYNLEHRPKFYLVWHDLEYRYWQHETDICYEWHHYRKLEEEQIVEMGENMDVNKIYARAREIQGCDTIVYFTKIDLNRRLAPNERRTAWVWFLERDPYVPDVRPSL